MIYARIDQDGFVIVVASELVDLDVMKIRDSS